MINIYKVHDNYLSREGALPDVTPHKDVVWVDLVAPTPEEDTEIEAFLGISIPTKQDMEEIELSSQFYIENGAHYMTLSAVAHMSLDNPIKTPLTFILTGHTLVTIRYEELMSMSNYVSKAKKRGGVSVATPAGIMCDILESLINRVADSLESVGADIDSVSRDIFRTKKASPQRKNGILQVSIRQIGMKGDLLSLLRESLASFSRFVSHYDFERGASETKTIKARLSVLQKDILSLSDHAGFLSGKMNFLLDATLGMINLEQNQIIKIFSVAAVVFLPPTMVATIYGMNFKHMPELGWHYGYPMSVFIMLVSALVPLLYFKKKGWL